MRRRHFLLPLLALGCLLASPLGSADTGGDELQARVDSADLAEGEEAFEVCASCHAFQPGEPAMIGPNLRGVVGREIASEPGFEYSDALKSLGGRWDRERLDRFLSSPKTYAPGTAMDSSGVRDANERAAIIAFLETLDSQ